MDADASSTSDGVVAVALALEGPQAAAVARTVEGALGWVVAAADDRVLVPRAVIADVPGMLRHSAEAARDGAPPAVLVVGEDDPPGLAARLARGAVEVLDGPVDATALRGAVAGLAPPSRLRPLAVVDAASGGVGASTVALALGGLHAWQHGPTLVALHGPAHVGGAPRVAAADLGSPAAWAAAAPVPGVEGLRCVRLSGGGQVAAAGGVPVVVERGPAAVAAELQPPDLLVCGSDVAGLDAAASTVAEVVVVVGAGPVSVARIGAAAGTRRVVALPRSARVGRAAAAGRVPADVPGTWLRPLVETHTRLVARATRSELPPGPERERRS